MDQKACNCRVFEPTYLMNGHGDRGALTARLVATRVEKTQILTAWLRSSLNGNHKPRQFWRERACQHGGRLRFLATDKSSDPTCPRFRLNVFSRFGAMAGRGKVGSMVAIAAAPHRSSPSYPHCGRLPRAPASICAGYGMRLTLQLHATGGQAEAHSECEWGRGGEYITSCIENGIPGVSRIASALRRARHVCQAKVPHARRPKASTHNCKSCKLRDIICICISTHPISNIYASARRTREFDLLTC